MNLFNMNFMDLGNGSGRFMKTYRCFSTTVSELSEKKSDDVRKGGKILMPPSALELLTRLNVNYPMMFKITKKSNRSKCMHCGVLEFIADEGLVLLPYWMMQNLDISEGQEVTLESVTLPIGSYVKFQPKTSSFLEIANQKAVLENALRNFSCLTRGDVVAIYYNNVQFDLLVKELKPSDAVNIIECDLNLDIEPPEGYEESLPENKDEQDASAMITGTPTMKEDMEAYMKEQLSKKFIPFSGNGSRVDGKKKKTHKKRVEVDVNNLSRGVPNYHWSFGSLAFIRNNEPKGIEENDDSFRFEAFTGKGNQLRRKKNR